MNMRSKAKFFIKVLMGSMLVFEAEAMVVEILAVAMAEAVAMEEEIARFVTCHSIFGVLVDF